MGMNMHEWLKERRDVLNSDRDLVAEDMAVRQFPNLLTAVEKVLEQVEFMKTDAEAMHHQGQGQAYAVLLDYAQVLREAIEGAINE